MSRPRITGRWRRPPSWGAPVWERPSDGARIHASGILRIPGVAGYDPSRLAPDLWRRVQRIEVTRRRRLMLFADLYDVDGEP